MRIRKAKIVDSKHLELEEPLQGEIGQIIQAVVSDNEGDAWKNKAKQHFFQDVL
ncbi:hypothetical protein [Candidatus Uabimicrobium amorphum]|uniref:Uncharacterized protein n=1 Tax=Uabimicrobium amorphum TaxID=2596890 RepID=A0A5S9ILS6_UABAM|nr:hypothetical protein [Candidatus Uabimicrobium amorphum]BBM84238.1 hypothetical protein UABAM_02594 [Candidatus Uabimicrobium amorphum]